MEFIPAAEARQQIEQRKLEWEKANCERIQSAIQELNERVNQSIVTAIANLLPSVTCSVVTPMTISTSDIARKHCRARILEQLCQGLVEAGYHNVKQEGNFVFFTFDRARRVEFRSQTPDIPVGPPSE